MFAQSLNTEPAVVVPTASVRLFLETVLVGEEGLDQDVPALSLSFNYSGVSIPLRDERRRFFVGAGSGMTSVSRNPEAERRAQCLLESFGVVEVECLDDWIPAVDSKADYLVHPEGNIHSWCSFTAYALPQLQALGWKVEVDADYPYQVVDEQPDWYANVEPDAERQDWFALELGVEVDGHRVNLVPTLLELLDQSPNSGSLQTLLRFPARFRAVPVGHNRYLTIAPERLKNLLRILLELYRAESAQPDRLCFPAAQAPSFAALEDTLEEGTGTVRWHGAESLLKRGRDLRSATSSPPAHTPGLRATLRPYQAEGVAWLQQLRANEFGGVLADDMGLGKTLQTIAHLATEKAAHRLDLPALIVMPTSLVGNWRREIEKFAPHLRPCVFHGPKRQSERENISKAPIVLTTYPILVRDQDIFKELQFHIVILDEAQAIKNPRSLAFRAVRSVNARSRLCISGTPVENNLEELWALFHFLMPELLGEIGAFSKRFRHPIEREGNEVRLAQLRDRVSPFILRRMKESVARDLPPKTEIIRPVELEGPQRDLYESIRVAAHTDVRKAIKNKGITGSTVAILDALMKLRQVCCDPRLVTVPSARLVTQSAKFELFFDLLMRQLEQDRRVLVFSQFTRMLALLAQGLEERNVEFTILTGSTVDRESAVQTFQSGAARVFLISLKAGGTGLNLTRADTVIHYDPWWNAAAQSQATDRAYRIGQTRPVFVYNLIVAGSVEERMLKLQQRKRQLAETLLSGGRASLSPDDLDDLFAPLSD